MCVCVCVCFWGEGGGGGLELRSSLALNIPLDASCSSLFAALQLYFLDFWGLFHFRSFCFWGSNWYMYLVPLQDKIGHIYLYCKDAIAIYHLFQVLSSCMTFIQWTLHYPFSLKFRPVLSSILLGLYNYATENIRNKLHFMKAKGGK